MLSVWAKEAQLCMIHWVTTALVPHDYVAFGEIQFLNVCSLLLVQNYLFLDSSLISELFLENNLETNF